MGPIWKIFVVATATAVLVLGSATGGAEGHAGYYYTEPTSVETYVARAVTLRSAYFAENADPACSGNRMNRTRPAFSRFTRPTNRPHSHGP
jgi:hypothetical protein